MADERVNVKMTSKSTWGRYTGQPLQVNVTPEMSDRIAKIAESESVSRASVIRDIIEAGIEAREQKGVAHGATTQEA